MGHSVLTDREIAEADGIFAVDSETGESTLLWGHECCAPPGPTFGGFRQVKTREVEIDNFAPEAVLPLIAQIERVKGTLPQDVRRLREQMSGTK